MSAYVDPLFKWPVGPRCFRAGCCHMTADTLDELLAFADRIGLRRAWLQDGDKVDRFHFDLTVGRRAAAIAAGAIEVDPYEFLRIRKARAGVVVRIPARQGAA